MFHREYWHPKTTSAADLASLAKRISATLRIYVYTLDPQPRLAASGDGGLLEKYALYGDTLPELPTEAAIFQHLDAVFKKLTAGGWVETEESLSYRAFVNRNTGAGKFWNVRLADRTCEIHFGKAESKRGPLHINAGTGTTKEFPTRAEALAAYHKMIREKLKKGYVELHPRATPYSTSSATESTPKKAPKRK